MLNRSCKKNETRILCPEHSSSSYESCDNGTEVRKRVPELLRYGSISKLVGFALSLSSSSSDTTTLCGFSPSQPSHSQFFYP